MLCRSCFSEYIFSTNAFLHFTGFITNIKERYYQILGHPSYWGSYKITVVCLSFCLPVYLSVRPSVRQFRICLRNGSLVFFWFFALWYMTGIFKNWQSPFFQVNCFLPNFRKKWPKNPKKIFCIFKILWKSKMKTSTVIDISPPFHVWGNYGSRVMGQNAVSQLNCRILQNLVYQESSEGWNLSLTSR